MAGIAMNPLAAMGAPGGDMGQAPGFNAGSPAAPPLAGPPTPALDVSKGLPVEVLASAVKLRLEGSRRMMTRERLLQVTQYLGQLVFNGQFLAQINQQGKTVDFLEFARMIDDAVGLEHTYLWMRDLTPQETQKLQQPPPQVLAAQQKTQQDSQTRMQIMQMKMQGDRYAVDQQARVKELEIQEESAQEILKLIAKEKSDILARQPDPAKQHAAVLEMMGKAQELQHAQEMHQLGLGQQQQQGSLDLQQQQGQGGIDLLQKLADAQASIANAKQAHMQDMNHMNQRHVMGLQQSQEKHQAQIQQMKERAAASRVLGGPEGRDRGAPSNG